MHYPASNDDATLGRPALQSRVTGHSELSHKFGF